MSWQLFTASFRLGLDLAVILCCFAVRLLYHNGFGLGLDFVTSGLAFCRQILFLLLQYMCCFLRYTLLIKSYV